MQIESYIIGRVFDGVSSKEQPARLRVVGERVTVEIDGGATLAYEKSSVLISDRVAKIPRVLTFNDQRTFVTDDNEGVDRLIKPSFFKRSIFSAEMSLRTALLSVAAIVVIFSFLYLVILPEFAVWLAPRLPKSLMTMIADQTNGYLESSGMFSEPTLTPGEMEVLKLLFAELKNEHPDLGIEFLVKGGKSVGANAFALPDARIILTEELVRLSSSQDEIRAVLYHEIGHIFHHHTSRILIERSAISLALLSVGGADALGVPLVLMTASYSRKHENEADRFAAEALLRKGLKPTLLGDVLLKMEEEAKREMGDMKMPSFLSSHPLSTERMENLKKFSSSERP